MTDKNKNLARPKEFKDYFGVSLSFTYELARSGRIPTVKIPSLKPGGKNLIRFRWADIYKFERDHYGGGDE